MKELILDIDLDLLVAKARIEELEEAVEKLHTLLEQGKDIADKIL